MGPGPGISESPRYLKAVVSESASENQYALLGVFVTLFFFAFYLYLQYLVPMMPPRAVEANMYYAIITNS